MTIKRFYCHYRKMRKNLLKSKIIEFPHENLDTFAI